jgi:RNA polymerase sigma-70 factor, ECF subfamily
MTEKFPRVLREGGKCRLYECMRPSTTSGFMVMNTANPVLEFEDFDRLVAQYRTRVFRFLFASLRDVDLAETLTQDCFWNAYRSRGSFRGECSINTWLMRIAVNLVRNQTRSRRFQFWRKAQQVDSEQIYDWPDDRLSPEERAAINEQVQAIWKATTSLSERQRTVFLLRFVEDLEIHEIAQSTGITVSAVNVHLFRAVRGIRRRLGKTK